MNKPTSETKRDVYLRKERIRALWLKGLTFAEICEQTGFSKKLITKEKPLSLKVRASKDSFKLSSGTYRADRQKKVSPEAQ